jgi:hypothetical protein
MMLRNDFLPNDLKHKMSGKNESPPMHVGKRTWKGRASQVGKGMLALGAIHSLPMIKQAYQFHQLKSALRKMWTKN